MKNQLKTARCVSANLAARHFAIVRDANLVWDILVGKLLFGLSDKRDLGNGIDTKWVVRRLRFGGFVKRARHRYASLLHGYGRQAREPDHIANGENIGLRRPVIRVDGDAAAIVRF